MTFKTDRRVFSLAPVTKTSAMMAAEEYSDSAQHVHDDSDWETRKEEFKNLYIDQNMTLKSAAAEMSKAGFDATPRQWERRIKQWGFQKYSTREDRLKQIEKSGTTIERIGRGGRLPRDGLLHPHGPEARNIRRFVKRELSRSRSRSRSNSDGRSPYDSGEQSPDQPFVRPDFYNNNTPPEEQSIHEARRLSQEINLSDMRQEQNLHIMHPEVVVTGDAVPWQTTAMQSIPVLQGNHEGFPDYEDMMSSQGSISRPDSDPTMPFQIPRQHLANDFGLLESTSNDTENIIAFDPTKQDLLFAVDGTAPSQQSFDTVMGGSQPEPLLTGFDHIPSFQFDHVPSTAPVTPIMGLNQDYHFASDTKSDEGQISQESYLEGHTTLHHDVNSLIEGYIQAVHSAVMISLPNVNNDFTAQLFKALKFPSTIPTPAAHC